MALDEIVIVREEDVANLYRAPNAEERFYGVLKEMGLLPLTTQSLMTDAGKSLLHLATWVEVSGNLHKTSFTPEVCGGKDFLQELVENDFRDLGKKFRPEDGAVILAEDSGALGRLIHAMGVRKTPRDHDGSKIYSF